LISRDFTLTEMVSLIQIEIVKKSEVKGSRDITPPKFQIPSRELSFWGVLVYTYLSQCRAFFKEFHHMETHCSLNLKLIQIIASLTWSFSPLQHKFCLPCLVPHIKLISFPLNSSFHANPAQTLGVEILTGLTWELCVEQGLRLSHNFIPSPHYSLFVTSIFILVHTYTTESLIRGHIHGTVLDSFTTIHRNFKNPPLCFWNLKATLDQRLPHAVRVIFLLHSSQKLHILLPIRRNRILFRPGVIQIPVLISTNAFTVVCNSRPWAPVPRFLQILHTLPLTPPDRLQNHLIIFHLSGHDIIAHT
jgi:hypothetical protein